MSTDKGAPSVDARIVTGAIIIKHKLKLNDREVVETIRENMYLQYFLGLSSYTAESLFDQSLFTAFRYRLCQDKFDQMSQQIIAIALGVEEQNKEKVKSGHSDDSDKTNESTSAESPAGRAEKNNKLKGKLKLKATVSDQMIKYPTDLDLL